MYTVWPTRVVADLVLNTVREEHIDTVRGLRHLVTWPTRFMPRL